MGGMYRSRRLARYAALVGLLVAVGCSRGTATPNLSSVASDGSVHSTATTSASPTASPKPSVPAIPADVPRTGHNVRPGEQPPEYPAAALAKTQAGANAFAEFYLKTLDWAYATTNPSYMKHYSGPTCGLCNGLATGIAKTAAAGHRYEGGRLAITRVVSSPIGDVTAPADFCSTVTLSVAAQSVVSARGDVINASGGGNGVQFKLCARKASYWASTYLDRLR